MKAAVGVLSLVFVICIIAYLFRSEQSSADAVAQYLLSGTAIAPTVCSISGGSFTYSIQGQLYIDGQAMRADYVQVDRAITGHIHVVSTDGDSIYVWNDDDTRTFKLSRKEFLRLTDLTRTGGKCVPWWKPDKSYFDIPETISFTPA